MILLTVIQMSIFSSLNFAYDQNIHFKHLTTNHGLSHSHVRCIIQDIQGFMWFGTFDGLNIYDGYDFTVYRNKLNDPNSVTSNVIRSIYEDSQGNLWIATMQGLCLYDKKRDLFINYNRENGYNLDSFDIRNVFKDSKGNLWIGSTENGLYLFDPKNNKNIHYSYNKDDPNSISSNIIRQIYEDSKSNLWIATEGGGLNLFNRDTKTFTHFTHKKNNPNSIIGNTIYAIVEDTEGNLWIGCYGDGLSCIHIDDIDTHFFVNYRHNPESNASLSSNLILSLCPDQNGGLWIGTENGGLNFLSKNMKTFINFKNDQNVPHSLNDNSIYSIYQDKTGNLWIGTYTGGINIIYQGRQAFKHYMNVPGNPNSLSNNSVWEFCEDQQGFIWIATDGGGLNKLDPQSGKFEYFNSENSNLNSDAMLTVYIDSQNDVWIGTWTGGVSLFNRRTKSFLTFSSQNSNLSNNNVLDIVEGRYGNLWFATQEGLNKFNRKDKSFITYTDNNSDLINKYVEVVKVDHYGNILMGTVGGFVVFNPETERFENYTHDPENNNTISNNFITSIYEEDSTTIWIGTSNGLNRIDRKTEIITRYMKTDGLPNNLIFGMEKDNKGFLWISTNGGISRFNLITESFKNYTKEDGLQGNTFIKKSHYKSRDGKLYFGGVNGFNVFDTEDIEDNKNIPWVVITDFRIFNKNVSIGSEDSPLKKHISQAEEIVMSYKQSIFSFEFVALNYLSSEKNQYAYMMEGFNKKWNYVGSKRTATYMNLNPGHYIFRVKASNNDGVWNQQGTSVKITITPPFWKTRWFQAILVIMVVGSAYSWYRMRVRHLENQKKKLEKQVKERTTEIRDKNKQLTKKNEQILSSIRYGERIQHAILPLGKRLKSYFPEHFILFKPRDIVSGDFYWFNKVNGKIILAVVDCTGHGVPGAFMSMLGNAFLNEIVTEQKNLNPAGILSQLNQEVRTALKQGQEQNKTQDGMDVCLCVLEKNGGSYKLEFAGAERPLYMIKRGDITLTEIKGERRSIGGRQREKKRIFKGHELEIQKGDQFYLTTDGFVDQQNVKNRRYGSGRLKNFLKSISDLSMQEQQQAMIKELARYQGTEEQRDDITMIGVRI